MPSKYLVPLSLLAADSLVQASVYNAYVSLSIELIGFPQFAGTKSNPNQFSFNLLTNLANAQGTPATIRVGGNSADRAIYDHTLQSATAGSCRNADPGAWQCIGPQFFDSYGAFPEGTLYSHNFNLATANSSGYNTLKATVPLACNALAGQLLTWEVGNEPDLYIGSRRSGSYSADNYSNEWLNATSHFESYLQQACPDLANNVTYFAPSLSSTGSRLSASDIFNDEGDEAQKISMVSVHNYMGGAQSPGVTLQNTLMNHNSVKGAIGNHLRYAQSVSDLGADYVIGEHNSLYGGGASGLSDVFGAALWAMDFSIYAASTNVIKRVHFHQATGSPYSAWYPLDPQMTNPSYYGKLAAATFLANSDTINVATINIGSSSSYDSGYTASVNGQVQRIALLNLREYDSNSGNRGSQTYNVNVPAGSNWVIKTLTAGGARDKTGVTFNGFSYDANSQGNAQQVSGKATDTPVTADGNGNLNIKVHNSEAVVLVASS